MPGRCDMTGSFPSAAMPRTAAKGPKPGRWPLAMLSWARAFPGAPEQAGAARRFVADLLTGSPVRDDAVAVISELFANAVVHTDSGKPGGLVTVQVGRWRRGVRIAVTDQGSASVPVIRPPTVSRAPAESGNGLFMVSRLARHLGWHDDASGRTICAILGTLPPEHIPAAGLPAAGRPQRY
jgi:anti-sigma regulatory factor (Ser/Thr protein kinase)